MNSAPAGAPDISTSGKEMLWEETSEHFAINLCSEKFDEIPRKHLRWSLAFIELQTCTLHFH